MPTTVKEIIRRLEGDGMDSRRDQGQRSAVFKPGTLKSILRPAGLEGEPMRYAVVFEKGPPNYSAHVPDLPGRVSVGDTLEEAKSETCPAIEFHLEGIRVDEAPTPKPSSSAEYVEVGEHAV